MREHPRPPLGGGWHGDNRDWGRDFTQFSLRLAIRRATSLCEDGILEIREDRYPDAGVEVECSRFVRLSGFEIEELDFVAYNKATASWQGDWWGEKPMTKEEAEAILAKYSRVDQGMRPISELLN